MANIAKRLRLDTEWQSEGNNKGERLTAEGWMVASNHPEQSAVWQQECHASPATACAQFPNCVRLLRIAGACLKCASCTALFIALHAALQFLMLLVPQPRGWGGPLMASNTGLSDKGLRARGGDECLM